MKIFSTFHAEEQIKEREIAKIWIEETIKFLNLLKRKGAKNNVQVNTRT